MNDKFMVRFVENLGHKQVFFIVWLGIGVFCVWILLSYYKSRSRRNFREGSTPPAPRKVKSNLPDIKR